MSHQPVVKPTSSTTKVRIVFNASADDGNAYSLNQCLLLGPKLQIDLAQILTRFRFHKFGMSCDIKKKVQADIGKPGASLVSIGSVAT